MKKKLLITLMVTMIISATGCSVNMDSLPIEFVENSSKSEISDSDEYNDIHSNFENNITSSDSKDTDKTTVSTLPPMDNHHTQSETTVPTVQETTVTTAIADSSFDLQKEAQRLYDVADYVDFQMLYTRFYFTLGEKCTGKNNMFHEVLDENFKTISDVKQEMRKTFADPVASQYDAMIDENFLEENGILYTYENGKGGDVTYIDTDLVLISSDDKSAVFNAVSHYIGDENIAKTFAIVCENGIWKVSEFSNPSRHHTIENSSEELTDMALGIYRNACNMFFNLVVNGTYFKTNGNYIISDNGLQLDEISDSRVSSIDDVKAEMTTVFSESFSLGCHEKIDQIYKERDGKVYQINQGKGSPIDSDNIRLNLTYADESTLKFNAFITDPYDSSLTLDAGQFTLIYENGWKVDNFEL